MVFLYDDKTYTYDDLLKAVSGSDAYYPMLRTKELFPFFVNLVKALAAGKPLTLIDSDMKATELEDLEEQDINQEEKIEGGVYQNMNELLEAISRSTSEVTLYTSGTTGRPKKVVHHMATLTRSVRLGEQYAGQIWAYAYNPTHMAGLQVFFQAFENQNTLVNVFSKPREEVYYQMADKQITHISATPTFYRLLLPFEHVCPTVVRVTLGGEKSDQHLYEVLHQIFPHAKINNVYASTEAGTLFAAKGDCFQIPASIREKIQIVDGELLIHQSLLGSSDSYCLTDGYYHSGDLVEWTDERKGLFRFQSRKDELINVGGYKVNPYEVEREMLTIEGIRQVVVYGKQNSILGNVLCADVVADQDVQPSELEIKKHLSSQLQDFKIPRRIRFVESLSLTRTGKLKRR